MYLTVAKHRTLHASPNRARHMAALAERVKRLGELIPPGRPVLFLDYPVHTNVGDLIIEQATERFLNHAAYKVIGARSAYDFGEPQARRVGEHVTIVLQGGGNFGDLYRLHQGFREWIVERFPRNRIVLLPQSLHYESDARMAECARVFGRHKHLVVCLRDNQSMDRFSRNFFTQSFLAPDMAHFLWAELAPARERPPMPGRSLVFFRQDRELAVRPAAGEQHDGPYDWVDLNDRVGSLGERILRRLHQGALLSGARPPLLALWRPYRDRQIRRAVRFASQYEAIRTDRLHMGLLGLLCGRDVHFGDNSYGKLSSYLDTWFPSALQPL